MNQQFELKNNHPTNEHVNIVIFINKREQTHSSIMADNGSIKIDKIISDSSQVQNNIFRFS